MDFRHLGSGQCRGKDWQGVSKSWPKTKGRKTLQDCANSCAGKDGCTAFDISQPEKKKFECVLYGHDHPESASGVPGECYQVIKGSSIKKKKAKGKKAEAKKSGGATGKKTAAAGDKKKGDKEKGENPLEG